MKKSGAMDIEQTYEILDNKDGSSDKREVLIIYLRNSIESLVGDPELRAKIAYDIAGLMSTSYALSLKDGDPIEEILTLAGELEANDSDVTEDKWKQLVTLINSLT